VLTTLAVLLVFTTVVVIHELGHLLVCLWLGVRVERFAVGFGKEIFGFNWKNIRWSFCILPLGGYVKPAGEEAENNSGAPDEYFGQSWYRRIAIALAGPVMNYILAFACFFWVMFYWGEPRPNNKPVIGEVVSGYPAQIAGFKKGDRIVGVNGNRVQTWEEMAALIHKNPEQALDITYIRESDPLEEEHITALVPKRDPQNNRGLIGISPSIEMHSLGFKASLLSAKNQTIDLSVLTLRYLGNAIKKAIVQREKPDIELAGPIGIVKVIANVAHEGAQALVSLIAIISLNLGLFNLFPIPLLDGGHVFLYLLEGLNRKPLNKKAVQVANIAGATFLIMIFLFATTQDIFRLKSSFWK